MNTLSVALLSGAIACVCSTSVCAKSISVNFHVSDDSEVEEHQITEGEFAGSPKYGVLTDQWNNINVGPGGQRKFPRIPFPPTDLKDENGDPTEVRLSFSAKSTHFVGYAASAVLERKELGLEGNQDDLFNSNLSLGDEDTAVLVVEGLGREYTDAGYSLVIYSDTDQGRKRLEGSRRSVFTLTLSDGHEISKFVEDDDGAAIGDPTFNGQFILTDEVDGGEDYSNVAVFEGLAADSFTIRLSSVDAKRAAISGFQIVKNSEADVPVEIPEPRIFTLFAGLWVLALTILRRRR